MKKLYFVLIFLTLGSFMVMESCKHEPEEMPGPGGGTDCDTLNVTYPGTVYPLLEQYCFSCHSGDNPSAGLDFTDYNIVAALAENGFLLGSIRHEEGYVPMPQGTPKLSDCDISKIEIWVRDTTFYEPPPTECDTINVTYPGTVYKTLEKYCLDCHSGESPEAGLDFTDYNTVAYLAENGILMGAIKHEPGYTAMPPSGIMLPDCEISQLEIWIRDTTFSSQPGGIPCDPDTIYFQNTILPLLQSSCGVIGCHDPGTATERVILTDYNNIINTGDVEPFNPRESKLYKVMIEEDPEDIMPPPPRSPLTAEQKAAVFNWISQGALNNYCDEEECDTLNVTFSGTAWPIVQNHCFGCHSGGNPSGGISIENYTDLVAIANNGSLMGTIKHESGYSAMPKNGMQLSDCKITQIQKWIDDGTPNN
jgi:hypothetical protein